MPHTTPTAHLQRNIRLYPWYAAAFHAFAWMPIFFLYFSQHLTLPQVLQLEAIYYAAVVILEVPSGYLSDTVGRRATLLASTLALAIAYILFIVDTSFTIFATAQVFLAAGIALNSGTDTSFHYDSLASLNRQDEYDHREAAVARNGLIASALAAIAGSLAAIIALKAAYVVSLVAALLALAIAIAFTEPTAHEKDSEPGPTFLHQITTCLKLLRDKTLAWLFAFAVFMIIINHVPYEFYQPYIKLALTDHPKWNTSTPLVAGAHMAVAMLLGSVAAAYSIRIRNRLGTGATLLLAAALQTAVIAIMALAISPYLIPLILLRVLPRALTAAPLNAAITPRIPQRQRATFLSIQSLTGRLAFSSLLIALSLGAAHVDQPTPASINFLLTRVTVLATTLLILFTITTHLFLKSNNTTPENTTPENTTPDP